jgi:predicted molibdopterin-dependent oxidoreductase YjgC
VTARESKERVRIVVDGRSLEVAAGMSVAAALLNDGLRPFRRSVTGQERAPLCGMGVCYECRVTISGIAHRRACLVPVSDGLEIATVASDA